MERHRRASSCAIDMSKLMSTQPNLSFAGCGFLGIYHVGVASCMRAYAPHLCNGTIAGASAGSIAAAGLLCDVDLGKGCTHVMKIAHAVRSRTFGLFDPTFCLGGFVYDLLDGYLPYDAHIRCNGRLRVSVTKLEWPWKRTNVILDRFDTREELMQALVCSCFIPYFCGKIPPTFKGETYYDGGLSDNIPLLDKNTITVSPWSGEADICPRDLDGGFDHVLLMNTSIQLSPSNLFRSQCIIVPPSLEAMDLMCRRGYDDCLRFLQTHSLITCSQHVNIGPSIHCERIPGDNVTNNQEQFESDTQESMESSRNRKISKAASVVMIAEDMDDSGTSSVQVDPVRPEQFVVNVDETDNDDDDEDEEIQEPVNIDDLTSIEILDNCGSCHSKIQFARQDSLPPSVTKALKMSSATINNNINFQLNEMGILKIANALLYLAFSPTHLVKPFGRGAKEWLYYFPEWMQNCFQASSEALYSCYKIIEDNRPPLFSWAERFNIDRHRFSARFARDIPLTELTPEVRKRLLEHNRTVGSSKMEWLLDFSDDSQTLAERPDQKIVSLHSQQIFTGEPKVKKEKEIEEETSTEETEEESEEELEEEEPVMDMMSSDTMENCMHVVDEMNSALEYYYDTDDGKVFHSGIYAIDRTEMDDNIAKAWEECSTNEQKLSRHGSISSGSQSLAGFRSRSHSGSAK